MRLLNYGNTMIQKTCGFITQGCYIVKNAFQVVMVRRYNLDSTVAKRAASSKPLEACL